LSQLSGRETFGRIGKGEMMTVLEELTRLNGEISKLKHALKFARRSKLPPAEITRLQDDIARIEREREWLESTIAKHANELGKVK
jgi:hypothetical protein